MEFKRLGELLDIQAGKRVNAKEYQKDFKNNLFPFLNCSVKPTGFYKHYNTDENSIISFTTASAGKIYWVKEKFWANDSCIRFFKKSNLLNYRFAYYFLKFQEPDLINSKHGSIISKLSINVFKNLLIPLPSLNQQQKIVNFLDIWTVLINDLETEQVKRTEQFNFYLNHIFKNINADRINLKELIKINKGSQLNKELIKALPDKENIFPVINGSKTLIGYWKESNVKGQTITIAQGGQAGWIEWQPLPFYAGGHCFYVELLNQNLLNRFLYFAMKYKQEELLNKAIGVTIKGITKDDVYSLKIPFLPLKEQQKISENLDKLHSLTFDDLPKEIELRKQQFQYYLNQIFLHLK